MDLMKLQNLLNECIMIEQGNYLGGNFSVDLAEAQAELDKAKQLLIPRVVRQSKQFYCASKEHYPEMVGDEGCDKQCVRCNIMKQ